MYTPRARICLVAPEFIGPFPNGGVGTACYWEATTLAAAGFDVTVLYTGPTERETPAHWEAAFAAGPFAYVDLWRWADRRNVADNTSQPCIEARTAELVMRFVQSRPFDLLLLQEFLGHGLRTLQARRTFEALASLPAAVTLHSCRQWIYEGMRRLPTTREDLFVDFLERESARLADSVVAPSQHMSAWAASHWRLDAPPAVVPYCYDASVEGPAELIQHRGPFTQLVFFGRLETRKGLHVFCRALAEHPAARGPVTTVTFLGKASSVEGRPSEEFIRETLGAIEGLDIRLISDLGSIEALQWLEAQRETLVVAPSMVDNLPYAVIELFARRLPLISTRVGGIPEIVGRANEHVLADPTTDGLAQVLANVHRHHALTIDYRSGYDIKASNVRHVEWVRSLLNSPSRVERSPIEACNVVIVDATPDTLAGARQQFVEADASAARSRFLTWAEWRLSGDARPAVFASAAIQPRPQMTARLMEVLADSRVSAATSYYASQRAFDRAVMAPLGSSLEAGWTDNLSGGPCFAARGAALDVVRRSSASAFRFWPAYAALACADLDAQVVPQCLYDGDSLEATAEAAADIAAIYQDAAPQRLDLGWVLKYAATRDRAVGGAQAYSPSAEPTIGVGRAVYEQFALMPDAQLKALSGLSWRGNEDRYVAEIRRLRPRLAAIAAEWQDTAPRVFIYGAGEHTRLLLSLEPELGRFVAGFVDRRPMVDFLGKPCIRPDDLTTAMADVVLYSSREFEREMYACLAHLDVRHVLLYSESPAMEPETLSLRVKRRLGGESARVDDLWGMYRPPAWVQGGCSHGDVAFLLELITATNPHLVLEMGVASGTSSAAMLFALDRLPPAERMLFSGDVRHTCYFDPSKPTGAAVHEMYPQFKTRWLLDTDTDARRACAKLPVRSVDFCFIDANHCHPWPLLDLLHVARVARPQSWIAIHDIELPRLHPQFQVHGPQWLFEAWPFNKIHGVGDSTNVGALQLPADLSELVPMALELLERPWENAPTTWDVNLSEVFVEVTRAVAPRLGEHAAARIAV